MRHPKVAVGDARTKASDSPWAESSTEFYRSRPSLAVRMREAGFNAAIRVRDVRDKMLRRLGLLGEPAPGVHLVYLHHVFADEVGAFRELLVRLARHAQIISHSEAVERIRKGAIERTYVSLSFDDGLSSGVDAAHILDEFGARGCFFVCPGVVDRCKDDAWIARWCDEKLHKPPARVMTWDDLEDLQRRGHEIGNHTMHHVDLAALGRAARAEEISASRERLVERLGDAAGRHFAWPYGEARHVDRQVVRDVMAAGHESCSSAVRGVHLPGPPMTAPPILLRNHALFSRPVAATEFFMRRNVRSGASEFRFQGREGSD